MTKVLERVPTGAKVFVLKWALTSGVFEARNAQYSENGSYLFVAGCAYALKRGEVALTRDEALEAIRALAVRKIVSLRKQIKKLEMIVENPEDLLR